MPKKLLLLRPFTDRLRLPSKLPRDSLNPNSSPKLKPEERQEEKSGLHHIIRLVIRKEIIIVQRKKSGNSFLIHVNSWKKFLQLNIKGGQSNFNKCSLH